MKNKLISLPERLLLKKRGLIESVNDQLKNVSQIEHTRHRSVWNFLSNLMGGLLSYTFQAVFQKFYIKTRLAPYAAG